MTKPHSKRYTQPGKPIVASSRKQAKKAARKIKSKQARQKAVARFSRGKKK